MTNEIKGFNLRFMARNAEIVITYLINETQLPEDIVKERATNLACEIWQNNSPNVSADEVRIALANLLAELTQWAIDHDGDDYERHKS